MLDTGIAEITECIELHLLFLFSSLFNFEEFVVSFAYVQDN